MNPLQRRAKDLATDCYNVWSKWCEIHKKSVPLVEKIGNKRILLLDTNSSKKVDYDFDEDQTKFELSNSCQRLRGEFADEFQRLVEKMEKISTNFAALNLLVARSKTEEEESLFSTWTVSRVYESVCKIYEQLKEESLCKLALLETLPFANSRELIEICTAAWIHQAYLNENEIHYLTSAIATEANLL